MASKFVRKSSLYIKGILNIEDEKILIEVDGIDMPINLSEFASDFEDCEVTITINHSNELS